jgi:hypothetical protein
MASTEGKKRNDRAEHQRHWMNEISSARKMVEAWHNQGDKVVDKYLDKRGRGEKSARRYNLFNTNTNILMSALFARIPKPEVGRRFQDPNDHAGRVASNLLRRALITESDTEGYFTTTAKDILKDRVLPGAGFAWIRYVPEVVEDRQPLQITDNQNEELSEEQQASPIITDEHTPAEHVHWKDVLWSRARTWNEVTWVARRAFLSKSEFKERFPEAKRVEPTGATDSDDDDAHKDEIEVWEIWDKVSKKVFFFCDSCEEILEVKDDPYGLPHFFPTPRPLFANVSTSSLVPTPDYTIVQDQYEELNSLHARKSMLIRACKVAGVYDAENSRIADVFEQDDNRLVPVDQWAAFAEKGGLQGAIQFVPLDTIAGVIAQLNVAIEQVKGQIQELTGISDIVRGSTSPYETAAAQGMKAQYASLRLQTQQSEVAEFFSEMFSIKAFLMAKFYSPETLIRKAGRVPQADQPYLGEAIALIKDELLSHINVEIGVDQLQAPSQQQLAQETAQVMTSLAGLIGQAFPIIQQMPESKSLFLMLAKKSVSTMPGAREIEGAIDQELEKLLGQQEGPSPQEMAQQQAQQAAQAQAQQAAQLEQAKLQQAMQLEQAKAQQQAQLKQLEIQAEMQKTQMQIENDTQAGQAKLALEQQKVELEARKLRLEELKLLADSQGAIDTSELDLPLGQGMQSARQETEERFLAFMAQQQEQMQMFMAQQQEQMQMFMAQQQAANAQMLQALMSAPQEPATVVVSRDENGRMVGTIQ